MTMDPKDPAKTIAGYALDHGGAEVARLRDLVDVLLKAHCAVAEAKTLKGAQIISSAAIAIAIVKDEATLRE